MNVAAVDYDLRDGFTSIPNALYGLALDTLEKMVLFALMSYKWQKKNCWPSQRTLSRDTGIPQRTLIRVLQRLNKKMIVSYKRRGYGMTNRYEFLDPTIDAMIERLMSELATAQASESAPKLATAQASESAPELATAQASESAPELATAQINDGWVDLINQIKQTDQIDQPTNSTNAISAKVAGDRSAKVAQLRSAKMALHEKDSDLEQHSTKKHTQSASARVCLPRSLSRFSRQECIEFATTLPHIINPYGYGTSIWQDGRDDDRVAAWKAAQQPQPTSNHNQINLSGGYDPNCQHCLGRGLRSGQIWWADEMIECDCNKPARAELVN